MQPVNDSSAYINYSSVMDKYAVGELHVTVEASKLGTKKRVKSALILCLDRSGSMGGAPMKAVAEGAYEVAKMHSQSDTFDMFLTIAFDDRCETYEYVDLDTYKQENDRLYARGGTSFNVVFDNINNRYSTGSLKEYEDCTIMFMTDGCTDTNSALSSLAKLTKVYETLGIKNRFFCIGFSRYHDANLLGQIARSGSDMGNFVYIKEDSANYKEEIVTALNQAFELAPGASSLSGHLLEDKEDGYSMDIKVSLVAKDDNSQADGSANYYTSKVTLPLDVVKNGIKLKFDFETIDVI